jgi:FkbM family methyltransferase
MNVAHTSLRAALRKVTRLYPLHSGGARLAQLRPLRALTSRNQILETQLSNGARIVVQANDFIGRTIYFFGDYDPKITWICKRILRPGDVFLDVGANMGVYSLFAASLVGSRGAVHAFEPQPKLAEGIERSARMNGFAHVHVHAVALSERQGELPLYLPSGETCTASLVPPEGKASASIIVPVKSASEYLEGLGIGPVKMLKLDVERHELEVMRGARRFFEKRPPPVIVFESHDDGRPFYDRPLVQLLDKLGYRFFQLPKALLVMRLAPMARVKARLARGFDFVGVLPGTEFRDIHRALRLDSALLQ